MAKYYKQENNKYTDKWTKANCHKTNLKYVNWQYEKLIKAASQMDMSVTAFIRQAVVEKLNKMGIDLFEKEEKTE